MGQRFSEEDTEPSGADSSPVPRRLVIASTPFPSPVTGSQQTDVHIKDASAPSAPAPGRESIVRTEGEGEGACEEGYEEYDDYDDEWKLDCLPHEVLWYLAEFISLHDLPSFFLISKTFAAVRKSDNFWRDMVTRYVPGTGLIRRDDFPWRLYLKTSLVRPRLPVSFLEKSELPGGGTKYDMKILLIGASRAGKSSLVKRFQANKFVTKGPSRGLKTTTVIFGAGMDHQISAKAVVGPEHAKDVFEVRLVELGGSEKARRSANVGWSFTGTSAVLLCFDLEGHERKDAESLKISPYLHELNEHWAPGRPRSMSVVIVGCRCDCLVGKSRTKILGPMRSKTLRLARSLGWNYVETSSSFDVGVREAFGLAIRLALRASKIKEDFDKETKQLTARDQ